MKEGKLSLEFLEKLFLSTVNVTAFYTAGQDAIADRNHSSPVGASSTRDS